MAGIGGIIPSAQCLCGPKGPDENVSTCIPALQGGIPFFVIGAEVHGAIAILWRARRAMSAQKSRNFKNEKSTIERALVEMDAIGRCKRLVFRRTHADLCFKVI